jgi:signal transduction histidine kinase
LNRAALSIAGNLSLDETLRQIVESARKLVNAEYAALGVPDGKGELAQFIHSGLTTEAANKIGHLPRGKGLLGAILNSEETIRLSRLQDDPRSIGFPENHPLMDSFLGVPVRAGNEIVGNLYLTNKQGNNEFSAEDEALVELFASHVAVAIKNAQLYAEVSRLAVVEERTRIGMDLHDGIIQSIYAVGLILESARLTLPTEATETDQLIGHAIDGLNGAIGDIRNFILDLRPRHFEGDLGEGLGRLIREFRANTVTKVENAVDLSIISVIPAPVSRAIFLTTQEALANVARHAKATQVCLTLTKPNANEILLQIEDNGIGFETDNHIHQIGHGLANMKTRAQNLNGKLLISSSDGSGTIVTVTFPIG